MAAEREPRFTGTPSEDIVELAGLVRDELMGSVGRMVPFFDDFTIGCSDGTTLLATAAWPALVSPAAVETFAYRLEGLAEALELIEGRYWTIRARTGAGTPDPESIAALDREVIQRFVEAADGLAVPSLLSGAHVGFNGTPERPQWSLFVQNTPVRRLLGSAEASSSWRLFQGLRGTAAAHVVYMAPPNPLAPIGVTVPQTVKQLRAQRLEPDVILLARRGMAIRATTPQDLWRLYRAVTGHIDQEIHARLRKLPWLFQGMGALFDDEFTEPAVQAVRECLGADLQVRFWPASREGVLRKAMGSPELIDLVAAGFPDHHTARLGAGVPLHVALDPSDSVARVAERIHQAWEEYRHQHSEVRPLHGHGVVHRPSLILLGGIGVVTAVNHADEEHAAFAALIETLVAAEGARAFGGMRPVPYEETFALVNSPLRYPVPGEVPPAPLPEEEAAAADTDEGTDTASP